MANAGIYNGDALCHNRVSALGLGVGASSGAEGCGFDPPLRTTSVMWTCPKCGEKLEDQFDSCWKCVGRPDQKGSLRATARRIRTFFLFGISFEVALIGVAAFLPDCWLQVEVRNFAVIVHYPFLAVLGNANDAFSAILGLLLAIAVLGTVWGFLFTGSHV